MNSVLSSNIEAFPLQVQSAIKLVIAYEWGRVGNQLFQYAAIKKVVPRARILTVGMDSLVNWLHEAEGIKVSIKRKVLLKILRLVGRGRMIDMAGKGKLFSLITERHEAEQCIIKVETGILSRIAVLNGFFQDEQTLVGIPSNTFLVDGAILAEAKEWIDSQTSLPRKHHYFVHVRRGDYVTFPSRDSPAVLPCSWYRAQIERIMKLDSMSQFFVFSDDIPYVEEMLDSGTNIFISRGSEPRDLAAMSLCYGGGVLSASSFAWWGAYYAKQNNPEALFLAPRFWCGWRQGLWYPPSIETSWIKYVEVF